VRAGCVGDFGGGEIIQLKNMFFEYWQSYTSTNMYFIWMVLEAMFFQGKLESSSEKQQIDRYQYHFDRQSFGKRFFCCKSCAFLAGRMICSSAVTQS